MTESRPSRHVQLATLLAEEVSTGRWRIGTRLPTTRQLAKQYRTSLSTVQAALGILQDVGVVATRPGAGIWVVGHPGEVGTALRRVAVILPMRRHFERALDGIAHVLTPRGVEIGVTVTHSDARGEIDAVSHAFRAGADALIMAPIRDLGATAPLWTEVLAELAVPVVFIERQPPDVPGCRISHVTSDLRQGTRAAVAHLLSHGRHQLALYVPGLYGLWRDIVDGFVEAAHQAGAPLRPELIEISQAHPGQATEFARRCLEYGADAVFAAHEAQTIELLGALSEVGLRAPTDLSVMELCDRAAESYSLSGLRLPRWEIGATAARILVDRFESRITTTSHVNMHPELVIRTSCGSHD